MKLTNKYLLAPLYWLSLTFLIISLWLKIKVGRLSFEQILYHLQFGVDGLIDADKYIFYSFFSYCILLPLILTAIILFAGRRLSQRVNFIILISCLAICTSYFIYTIALYEYFTRNRQEDYIAKNYIEPKTVNLTSKPQNLILIYVESLEDTYSNKKIFEEDLLASLNNIPADKFAKFRQIHGANWTIASMVSTMCAIPLKGVYTYGTVLDVNDLGGDKREFLPNINCLGDILHTHGYTNVYMGGAALGFGAKGKFLRDHGYNEVLGRDEFANLGSNNFNRWGLYDYELFEQAKTKVDYLEKQATPYNLTLLTLDTHTPNGYISSYCQARGVTNYKGIIKCTADVLHDFIAYLNERNYLKHTQVVILGDHLVMGWQNIEEDLDQYGERMVYNKFILNKRFLKNREEIIHLDMLPTILYTLGFSFPENKLGLGISGFGEAIIEAQRFDNMHRYMMGDSAKYYSFWRANNA